MKVHLAGVPFEIGPDERLCAAEKDALERFHHAPLLAGGVEGTVEDLIHLSIVAEPPWTEDEGIAAPGEPAAVTWAGERVRMGAHRYRAELDPRGGYGTLYREGDQSGPMETVLRVFLACRLPVLGGLPLHAAGISLGSSAAVFYGVSGAGKSTISAASSTPVLSDESIVALMRDGRFEVASGAFRGTQQMPIAPRGFLPLGGLFELQKGPATRIERLSSREAYLSLLPVITIPDAPQLWSEAVACLARLVDSVPVYRIAWTPSRPPWNEVGELLKVHGRPR